jgi:hypothetical protein
MCFSLLRQFGIAERFIYYSLLCIMLAYWAVLCTACFSVAIWYGVSLYVLRLTVWEFGIADMFMYCR